MAEERIGALPFRARRKELPDVGELVIGTVLRIADHGAYVYLDEYLVEAYAPMSEVLTSWFRSIKDYLREGQKTVFRVVAVNPVNRYVEVSYKRVRADDRERKMENWKRLVRTVKTLENIAKKLGKPQDVIVETLWKLDEAFDGDPYRVFEVAEKDPRIVEQLGIDPDVARAIVAVAEERARQRAVTKSGIITALSVASNGVEEVRKALETIRSELTRRFPGLSVKLYVIGPPRYRIDITGRNPKEVDAAMSYLADVAKSLRIAGTISVKPLEESR